MLRARERAAFGVFLEFSCKRTQALCTRYFRRFALYMLMHCDRAHRRFLQSPAFSVQLDRLRPGAALLSG